MRFYKTAAWASKCADKDWIKERKHKDKITSHR